MKEAEIIFQYHEIRNRAAAVGITVKTDNLGKFTISDVPTATGLVCFDNLNDLNNFVYGYVLGYETSL